ncbi:MAG: hypothetical protein CM1200mP35_04880 [Chloroflexota bacterium]|nr:MAG: hypothetical protein CM1200mP35_04880 [Chloroflexota bacterium]
METTTSGVLTQPIVREGFKNIAAGANGQSLKSGIDKAVATAVAEIGGYQLRFRIRNRFVK